MSGYQCGSFKMTRWSDTKTWEDRPGGYPSLQSPPDTQQTSPEEVWVTSDSCQFYSCPAGTTRVKVSETPPSVDVFCYGVDVHKWYEIDPETHVKTYFMKEKKEFVKATKVSYTFACFDTTRLKEIEQLLREHFPF
jgi:hypothetical protein